MSFSNVYFVEFEQVNVYLRKIGVWSLTLIYCNCGRGDGN